MVKCLQDFSKYSIALATRNRQFSAVENNTRKQYFLFRLFKKLQFEDAYFSFKPKAVFQ